jgi:hypothetical protein
VGLTTRPCQPDATVVTRAVGLQVAVAVQAGVAVRHPAMLHASRSVRLPRQAGVCRGCAPEETHGHPCVCIPPATAGPEALASTTDACTEVRFRRWSSSRVHQDQSGPIPHTDSGEPWLGSVMGVMLAQPVLRPCRIGRPLIGMSVNLTAV